MPHEDRMAALQHVDRYPSATVGSGSVPRTLQFWRYGRPMSNTRYGHANVSGGNQDQGERKDEGWESRQGGRQSRPHGSDPAPGGDDGRRGDQASEPPLGTNTQGIAGIAAGSDETREQLAEMWQRGFGSGDDGRDERGAGETGSAHPGTDQPRRMGGPLGPDPDEPHLPEGAQDNDSKGTGAGGFDRGVDATNIGAVHQGVRPEDPEQA